MPIVMICLNSCTKIDYKNNCPIYPTAGHEVAQELEQASYENYPKTWEWLGRINKLREELELCQKDKP